MEIIAHRGLWRDPQQKNSNAAIRAAVAEGFGVEIDLRDRGGRLVVAHDLADDTSCDFAQVLDSLADLPAFHHLPWALNIKADGLQCLIVDTVQGYGLTDAFCFDMSVPDGLGYLNLNGHCRVYTRHSEYEPEPPFYAEADGVWLDEFHTSWITNEVISEHRRQGKLVCVVSPELHGRDHLPLWHRLAALDGPVQESIQLCTDYPVQAREFFRD